MTLTFYRLSIVAVLVFTLLGCSLKWGKPDTVNTTSALTTAASEAQKTGAQDMCQPEKGSPFHLQKVILVAGTISVPYLARDLPGLPALTSKRLQDHLDALERFTVKAMHDSSFQSHGLGTQMRVKQLGVEHAAQFIVKLEIEDLTLSHSKGLTGLLFKNRDRRDVIIRSYLYDTEYGSLFDTQRYQRSISGDVTGYRGNSGVVTPLWFSTSLGKEIDGILEEVSVEINKKLACIPFSTKVTAVNGNDIHINAGHRQGIRPGETLRLYRRSNILNPTVEQKQIKSDVWIQVNTVFPDHSIASTTQGTRAVNRLNTGDVVRAW
ncbi:MAG: FlgT C-terminal domain-containing protein [Granulosicoccus sp.]